MLQSEEVINPIENIAQNTTEESVKIVSPDSAKTQEITPLIDNEILNENTSDKKVKQIDEAKIKIKRPIVPQKQKVKKKNTPLIIIQQNPIMSNRVISMFRELRHLPNNRFLHNVYAQKSIVNISINVLEDLFRLVA